MDQKSKRLIEEISDSIELLTPWERDFIESVSDQLSDGRELSEKQRTVIRRIHGQRILGW